MTLAQFFKEDDSYISIISIKLSMEIIIKMENFEKFSGKLCL